MPAPTSYLPLATSESAGPPNPSNSFPATSLKRRIFSLRGLIVLCLLVFGSTSLWLLQSTCWTWLDSLDSSNLYDNLRIGPLELLYRGRARKIGWWRYQDRETHKHERVQGMDKLPSASSRTRPKDEHGPRLLIGVFTTAEKVHRRDMIRELEDFNRYCTPQYGVECKFVIGKFYDAALHEELLSEMDKHSDIILLDHNENMNKGKIYDFYKHVAQRKTNRPQFVMKQDDDSFVHIPRLLEALVKLDCSQPTYFGACWHDTCGQFLGWPFYYGGMAYGVSWPLLSWIADENAQVGASFLHVPEDILTGRFINSMSRQDRDQVLHYSLDEQMGNYKDPFVPWDRDSVIVVHGMKVDEKYAEMASFVSNSTSRIH